MKTIFKILPIITAIIMFASCVEHNNGIPAEKPNAGFTISPNPANVDESVIITLNSDKKNEHNVVFAGDTGRNYDNLPQDSGRVMGDKFVKLVYNQEGNYTVTVVSRNYEEWGKSYKEDTYQETIEIIDDRNTFTSFEFPAYDIEGVILDSSITYTVSPGLDRSALTAKFKTKSPNAVVTIDGVVQESNTTVNDFTNNLTYRVTAPSGSYREYIVSPDFNTNLDSNKAIDTLTFLIFESTTYTIDDDDTIHINYSWGARQLVYWKLQSDKSKVKFNGEDNIINNADVKNGDIITVIAQDLTTRDYVIDITTRDPITSFAFPDLAETGTIEGDSIIRIPISSTEDRDAVTVNLAPEDGLAVKMLDGTLFSSGDAVDISSGDTLMLYLKGIRKDDQGDNVEAEIDVIIEPY
jgi:hypothetical protein